MDEQPINAPVCGCGEVHKGARYNGHGLVYASVSPSVLQRHHVLMKKKNSHDYNVNRTAKIASLEAELARIKADHAEMVEVLRRVLDCEHIVYGICDECRDAARDILSKIEGDSKS